MTVINMNGIQERCGIWRAACVASGNRMLPPSPCVITAKLLEEAGEVARAVIGDLENRPNRGDAVHEAAQVVLVLASLLALHYPHRNLFVEVQQELLRVEILAS